MSLEICRERTAVGEAGEAEDVSATTGNPVAGRSAEFSPGTSHNGIVMLDAAGRILETNAGACAIFAQADALLGDDNRIRALRVADDDALQTLILHAMDARSGAMQLPRRRGGRDYVVLTKPLADRGPMTSRVLLLIIDPDRVPEPTVESLRRMFALTGAEARLAVRLFAGLTLSEAASELQISPATSRVHLSHIFRKTRTARQAELIRLLMSYPWDELAAAAVDSPAL